MIKKKGALQLGISTIVVLVIAMVLIGAGISLINVFFKKGTDSLGGIFDNQDLKQPATRDKPLVLQGGKISASFNEEVVVPIGFFNTGQKADGVELTMTSCTKDLVPTFTGLKASSINSGDAKGFLMNFKIVRNDDTNKDAAEGVYICEIEAKGEIGTSKNQTLATLQTDIMLEN
ncbi:hypothetical protein K9L67_04490 [Candidatus Woesearchaeota archaeon]|nr:hypothetical protein [Candidatus Woesearchaeota archaeon]MCF7901458.1 hypothetical protein [Candidatus Woesearchaeota archaeon]MCF8013543.1 hypothetical protein [Candidatus Woesearchaeota archaeon]